MIDLRSDTVTKPTIEMRKAMAAAEVGDDVFKEDPTINTLEKRTAEILGREAAVYMPSGTMTNQIAIRAHTEHGDEIMMDAGTHTYYYEAGGPAALSGVMCRFLNSKRGIFTPHDVIAALRPHNLHFPVTRLICIENTHNYGGGSIWPIHLIAEISATARTHGIKMHLDGARLWNASAASKIPELEYARYFDSVSVCFSKGLGAPVGSVLAGSAEFIDRARRFRKQFGGGMRQAGIIAAGALYALENHRSRLTEDHTNARIFAEGIHEIHGIELDLSTVETNIIRFQVSTLSAEELTRKLKDAGVYVLAMGLNSIRAVTHLDVSQEDIEKAVGIVNDIMR